MSSEQTPQQQGQGQNNRGNGDPTPSNTGQQEAPSQRQPPPPPPPPAEPPVHLRDLLTAMMMAQLDSGGAMQGDGIPAGFEHLFRIPTGSRPAAPYIVSQLDEVTINSRNRERIGSCSVCTEEFELDTEVLKLPCKHYYHHDCIHAWLKMHNTCPCCRAELPTLDPEYDESRRRAMFGDMDDDGYEAFASRPETTSLLYM
eukprot:TRINITY_DN7533_c0_g1_i2.p1 TRINITY_DN7533_c0_g1~~TRINITY_DN7533_c0_g1_i2.p1  ORF type:complete len:212 (-),score=38.50 TRINITY_DN7533_c0_g1_i2:1-600(-)